MSEGKIRDLKIADFVYDNKTLVIIEFQKLKKFLELVRIRECSMLKQLVVKKLEEHRNL